MDLQSLFVADLLIAFNLGLVSQVHCLGMCGGVVAALTLAIDPAIRERRGTLRYALAYNGGRIASYAIAGSLLGAFGSGLLGALQTPDGHHYLRVAAALLLVAAGLSLLGVPRFAGFLERAGQRLWRQVQQRARRLIPIRTVRGACLFGMLWGWLPCALVYAALAHAAASAAPARAAALMIAFGLGTAPALVAGAGALAAGSVAARTRLRRVAGSLLVILGCVYPFVGDWFHVGHAHH